MSFKIGNREIGAGHSTYIVAEMSANHNCQLDQAIRLLEAAKDAGADAVKIQTYTPDTLTINCDNRYFHIGSGTIWDNKNLYQLYREAYTPWDWQPKLKKKAEELGLNLFSTPFDETAVDFLEELDISVYKIASFEIVDIPFLKKIARTGKPIIMSTGMASLTEIDEAVRTIRKYSSCPLALLKCTSAYPAQPVEMNLKTILHLSKAFNVPVGLSDHSLGADVAIAAVAMGASIIEKHFTVSRTIPSPDSLFSMEPVEFKAMVTSIRNVENALGKVSYDLSPSEQASRIFRRSLFVVKNVDTGELFSTENVRSIRPGYGMHTRYLDEVLGRRAACKIKRGTPLTWNLVGGKWDCKEG